MIEPFRWRNCFADVLSNRNGEMAQSYIRDVVEPSLAAMQSRISSMRVRLDDPIAMFGIGPAEELLHSTLLGYSLSIQAMWEKQIRGYLQGCARELNADSRVFESIQKANWYDLNAIFSELRCVPLTAFEEFPSLNLLQLLANVCRHGNGPSLDRLADEHPELWPPEPKLEFVPPPPGPRPEPAKTAENLQISVDLLKSLAGAINSFWQETEYIYNESIERKADSLEAMLGEERRIRAGRGRPWDPPTRGLHASREE